MRATVVPLVCQLGLVNDQVVPARASRPRHDLLIRRAQHKPEAVDPWLDDLLLRKPARLVTIALANRAARVVWAIMVCGGVYRTPAGVMAPV